MWRVPVRSTVSNWQNLNPAQFKEWGEYVPHSANPKARTPDEMPESGALDSYGIYKGSDAIVSDAYRNGDLGNFDSFHEEVRDVPLSKVTYYNQQRVVREHVDQLAKQDPKNLEPAWGQAQPDGTMMLIEGHHRAAAAARRGDTHVKMTVYGKWDRETPRPPGPIGRAW
jgi:hypothetical protein